MEYPPVVRTPQCVGQVLPIECGSYGGDQSCAVVDVDIDSAVAVIPIPRPTFDGIAALTVVPTVKARCLAALDGSACPAEEGVSS